MPDGVDIGYAGGREESFTSLFTLDVVREGVVRFADGVVLGSDSILADEAKPVDEKPRGSVELPLIGTNKECVQEALSTYEVVLLSC